MVDNGLHLPIEAATLLPHRPPMILVEKLVEYCQGSGTVVAGVRSGDLFVGDNGQLEAVAMIELVAQSYAAIKGYDDLIHHRPVQKGFLVGSRTFKVKRCPHVGETMTIHITTTAELDGFSVVDGVIRVEDEVIAEGSVKLWLP